MPAHVHDLLRTLWSNGYAAYVVGGSVRDALMGRDADDWDLATSALPDQTLALFPDVALYENEFGTVAVRPSGVDDEVEITTFRSDHDYADFRRPHHVEFSDSIELDLARRDATVNAMAWGAPAGGPTPEAPAHLVDPFGGRADLAARTLRAVGDPAMRFEEDALRMLRMVRLASTLEFRIEPATLAAMAARAGLVRHLSGERIAAELAKILGAARPSVGLEALADTGLLAAISPELGRQRGIPQNKVAGEDLWDHTMRAVDAVPADRPLIRLAALLHDIGKIGIRDNILLKEGPLTREERILMNQHPTIGAEIVAPASQLHREAPLIRAHHEWFNGSGYPDGIEALDIPLGARILTIADAYEAMTSSRPYRKTPLSHEQAVDQLEKFAGIQFDPDIVPILVNLDRSVLDWRPDTEERGPTTLERDEADIIAAAEARPPTRPILASDDVS